MGIPERKVKKMTSDRYSKGILTLIAVLLVANLVVLVEGRGVDLSIEPSAFAQSPPSVTPQRHVDDLQFYPWVNPNRFVFWDPSDRLIFVYDDDGELYQVWSVRKMGQDLTKRNRKDFE